MVQPETDRRQGFKPWLRKKEFRQALSFAADRQAIANAVYLGAAVPVFGPITPGFTAWHSTNVPAYPHDPARARQLLAGIGLTDRDGNGMLEDASGAPVRFAILHQQDMTTRERMVSVLQEQFRRVGIAVDVVGLDVGGMIKRWQTADYDSVFHGFQSSSTDPGMNMDFWLSSGNLHFWNPAQPKPGTEWEARIDDLMHQQVAARDLAERQRLFVEVQRIFGEQLPAIYFVAPKVTLAAAPRVIHANPAPCRNCSGARTPSPLEERAARADAWPRSYAVVPAFALCWAACRDQAVVLVLIVSSGALLLARIVPGDHFSSFEGDPKALAAERHRLGLDDPVIATSAGFDTSSGWISASRCGIRVDRSSVSSPNELHTAWSPEGRTRIRHYYWHPAGDHDGKPPARSWPHGDSGRAHRPPVRAAGRLVAGTLALRDSNGMAAGRRPGRPIPQRARWCDTSSCPFWRLAFQSRRCSNGCNHERWPTR